MDFHKISMQISMLFKVYKYKKNITIFFQLIPFVNKVHPRPPCCHIQIRSYDHKYMNKKSFNYALKQIIIIYKNYCCKQTLQTLIV